MKNGYDRVALIYDRLAKIVFGKRLLLAQAQHLHRLSPGSEIVIAGGGSGSILDLIADLPVAPKTIHYVDSSPRMIALARQRLASRNEATFTGSVHFIEMSADLWQPPEPVDALLTPFFLDCFDGVRLDHMLDHLSQWLRPDGVWLLTDFTKSNRALHRLTMATMFGFFRLTAGLKSKRLESYADKIESRGFISRARHEHETVAGPVASEIFQKSASRASIAVAKSPANLETVPEWSRH